MIRKYSFFLLFILVCSCSVKERPVAYGSDECAYCKMTIMDHRYGAELVTQKGKVFTFDAAECLIDYLYQHEDLIQSASFLLVTAYTEPDQLIDALSATYLVSKEMPSPMGAYLTAFSSREMAQEYQDKNTGDLYTWEELFADFRAIKVGVLRK
jgi:copper chaperone NosL